MLQRVVVFYDPFTKEMFFSNNIGQIHEPRFIGDIHLKIRSISNVRAHYPNYIEIPNPLPHYKPQWVDNSNTLIGPNQRQSQYITT